MNQKNLSRWLKGVVVGMAVIGGIAYGYVLPLCWKLGTEGHTTLGGKVYWIRMIFLWITAIPCYLALVYAWKIFTEIGKNNSFSFVNAKYLKNMARLALFDTAYYFIGNLVLFLCGRNHPAVLLGSLLFDFMGIAFSVLCAALSHLVYKAAVLKEESELTI